ncbi:MAG: tRNA glutamyl-Q(34) synthetase GluQRS [Thiohalomonadaceae bacterium]
MYIGRFAPSPTGPLHFGSLLAALASCLEARRQGGHWLVRMEDIDPPREMAGAADLILRTLERYGFEWDGPVMYQSRRDAAYRATLDELRRGGVLYACRCSRREALAAAAAAHLAPGVYTGVCRSAGHAINGPGALRVRTDGRVIEFSDRLQGVQRQNLEREVGDFVVRRADGLWAYQLAVVVDDAAQGVTDVVRGSDLLDSTPRQIHLQRLLGLPTPGYLHLPVAVNAAGEKLSKQTYAPALPMDNPLPPLWQALTFLGQQPPAELLEGDVPVLWQWAIVHWDAAKIPATRALPL